jgi:PTH1 family peptidyl-tRNA hydrolase
LKFLNKNPEWLVLGLGNIGQKYKNNRHNFGFMVVDEFAKKRCESKWKKKLSHFYTLCDKNEILIAKPRTMMNLSGIAAWKLITKYKIPLNKMLVLYDDLDLPLGKIRIRKRGSHGGHKGIKSIASSVQSEEFSRIRLGIGIADSDKVGDVVEYVLSDFTEAEYDIVMAVIRKACLAIELIIKGQTEEAMNRFN